MSNEQTFNNIALIGRKRNADTRATLSALIEFLQAKGCEITALEGTASLVPQYKLKEPDLSRADCCDLIIVVGGDGSLLRAAAIATEHQIPVLGINRGRLGFLTDIAPNELKKIEEVLNGNYQQEQRFLLAAKIFDEHCKVLHEDLALNDVVLLPGIYAHMIEFEILTNSKTVCSQRADGLIIATPTGSTAYALSGGGPILHPQLDAVALVPMFPHTLSSRPIVIDADTEIDIKISLNNETSPNISYDGKKRVRVPPGGYITINKHEHLLRLIHPTDYNYYETLRTKLGWQSSPQTIS